METVIIFSFTNELTGWTIDVLDHGDSFTAEQHDVDGAYMGHRSFTSEARAISYAILCS
jgi:hypothetical protein